MTNEVGFVFVASADSSAVAYRFHQHGEWINENCHVSEIMEGGVILKCTRKDLENLKFLYCLCNCNIITMPSPCKRDDVVAICDDEGLLKPYPTIAPYQPRGYEDGFICGDVIYALTNGEENFPFPQLIDLLQFIAEDLRC